jgi:hypothetical protein
MSPGAEAVPSREPIDGVGCGRAVGAATGHDQQGVTGGAEEIERPDWVAVELESGDVRKALSRDIQWPPKGSLRLPPSGLPDHRA